ncbi:hypothetical protein C8R44DRAFT_748062 [Mycena epipterygia]|nr:hypothetical protein C8R44DRAFT_748062 [Mycena epipterygia]
MIPGFSLLSFLPQETRHSTADLFADLLSKTYTTPSGFYTTFPIHQARTPPSPPPSHPPQDHPLPPGHPLPLSRLPPPPPLPPPLLPPPPPAHQHAPPKCTPQTTRNQHRCGRVRHLAPPAPAPRHARARRPAARLARCYPVCRRLSVGAQHQAEVEGRKSRNHSSWMRTWNGPIHSPGLVQRRSTRKGQILY